MRRVKEGLHLYCACIILLTKRQNEASFALLNCLEKHPFGLGTGSRMSAITVNGATARPFGVGHSA